MSSDLGAKIKACGARLDYLMQLFQVKADILGILKDEIIVSGNGLILSRNDLIIDKLEQLVGISDIREICLDQGIRR